MNNATLYVEDIADTVSAFVDIENMEDDAMRDVLTTICDTLTKRTGINVHWSTDAYSVHGWSINGIANWDDTPDADGLCAELNQAIEDIVNG